MPTTTGAGAKGTHAQRTGKSKAASVYTPPGELDQKITARQKGRRAVGRAHAGAAAARRAGAVPPPAGEDAGRADDAAPASGGRLLPSMAAGGVVQTGAGIVLGICAYGVLLNWIRGGPAQARGWIVAKLINKPYTAAKKKTA